MKFKFLLLFMGWMATGYISPDLISVRQDYRRASESEEVVKKLFTELTAIGKNDNTTLIAYKGAVTTMMAKNVEGVKDKRTFFKEGRELLEFALETEPGNVEIRCIRLSVQENIPKITGYHKDKEADKQFILDRYAAIKDKGAKEFVKGYVLSSDSFTTAEKQLF
ncbi:MAG: hypothetical protein WBG48_05700 [Pricia sp.]